MPKAAPAAPPAAPSNGASGSEAKPKAAPTQSTLKPAANPHRIATKALSTQTDFINIILYGAGGTGKSTSIATLANHGPTLIINAEGGLKTRPLRQFGINVDNLHVVPNDETGPLTFALLEDLFWQIKGDLAQDPAAWFGVGWDSLTEITTELLAQEANRQFERLEGTGKDRERFFTGLPDYGVMASQIRLLLRRFRDLPCHFAMTALERRDQDDEDARVSYGPAVIPSVQNDLNLYTDITCQTSVREAPDGTPEFVGLFAPVGKYKAKDRLGALPTRLVDPTFERILAYVQDKMTVQTDPVMQQARARRTAPADAAKPTEVSTDQPTTITTDQQKAETVA